jgi:hypothetical protein
MMMITKEQAKASGRKTYFTGEPARPRLRAVREAHLVRGMCPHRI